MREIDVGKLEDADRRTELLAFVERWKARAFLLSGAPHRPEDEKWSRKGMLLYIETADGHAFYVSF